jgi:Dockerin type I domain
MSKGGSRNPDGGDCVFAVRTFFILLSFLFIFISTSNAQVLPEDVLILVNQDSPTSRYIADLYQDYHSGIPQSNIVSLSGLVDSCDPGSTAAEEIITRADYNTLIAEPVRNYLIANDLVTSIKVIVTTAGMPYRIEDSTYADVIYPAGSNYTQVSTYLSMIDAASVESELTCLWYSDYGSDPFGLSNRMVNPYQGYRYSGIDLFERTMPDSSVMDWTQAITVSGTPPKMEGNIPPTWPPAYGPVNRKFNAGNIYLTCRLDGPKVEGKTAIPSVRAMLERAKRASSFIWGVNPKQAAVVLDDSPNSGLDQNRVYNLDGSVNYWVFDLATNQPPDAPSSLVKDDYVAGFVQSCGVSVTDNSLNTAAMPDSGDLCVMLDRRVSSRTNQADLDAYAVSHPESHQQPGVILLAGFGMNGDEGGSGTYLINGGPEGGSLFDVVNGAVFSSIESFNAVTMFTNVGPNQGKIVDFITIGGSGAIGHAFEPIVDAIVDNEFLMYNLLADSDGDFMADLTFVEAAFTAIPYLSWTEVVIGDPLMQICYNGQIDGSAWTKLLGDANFDGKVDVRDLRILKRAFGGNLNSPDPVLFDLYNDLCDLNDDGKIDVRDVRVLKRNM